MKIPGCFCLVLFLWTAGARAAALEDHLPPALPWRGASETLIAKPDSRWITPAEKTALTDSPSYDETFDYLKKLADASPLLSIQEFGRSAQGRALYVVVASKADAFTPEGLQAGGKSSVLAQGGIHSGEIDGKDAGLMLLRDIAFGGKDSLLDRANLLFVPIFNVDGHERSSEFNRPNQRGPRHQGWRTTAQNLNLNRDYMKADSPEMRAMLGLLQKWSPALYLDLHVTDGIDYQYDITFGYHGERGVPAWSPKIGAWLDGIFRPHAEKALRKAGHVPGPLVFARNNRDLAEGIEIGPAMPRYSQGYGDLRHLPAILVENHSLKPFRQRVLGTYVLLEAALRIVGEHGAKLREAISSDRNLRPASLPMNWVDGGGGQAKMNFLGVAYESYDSPISGGKEVRWLGVPKTFPDLLVSLSKADIHIARPAAYWVPVTKPEVIARLKLHGIEMETLSAPRMRRVAMYRLVNPAPTRRENFPPFEGRHLLTTGVRIETREEMFPAGSVRVSTDQPLGDLAMALLDPQSQDSLFAWGFFPEILQQTEYIEGYAIAPYAEQMLRDNPKLKAEFEAKLAGDEKFAKNSTARLRWFYERSPYFDDRYLLYPVGMEGVPGEF